MAEIKIKKKKPIWPLVLVALLIIALVYFIFINDNEKVNDTVDDVREMVTDARTSDTMKDNNAVLLSEMATSKISAYKTYIANDAEMEIDYEYSNAALTRLIDATEAIANSLGVDVRADLEKARASTDSITKDTNDLNHANKIKKTGNNITQALEKIQRQKYPRLNNNIEELHDAVAAIAPDKKVVEQKVPIKDFFDEAGKLLNNMKNT